MRTRLLKFIRSGSSNSDTKRQDRIPIFLFCLFLATIFWILTALTKEYSTHVHVPVTFSGIQANKVVSSSLPEKFDIVVRGSGFNLRRFLFSNSSESVNIDISTHKYGTGNKNSDEIVLSKEFLQNIIKTKLSGNIEIAEIKPESVKLNFKSLSVKRVFVKLNAELEFDRAYGLSGAIKIEPASVLISGNADEIAKIDSISTRLIKLSDIKENMELTIGLDISENPELKTDQNELKITIPVEKYTEGRVNSKVKVRNLSDASRLRLIPDETEIIYTVPLSMYSKVDASLFETYVDVQDTDLEKATRLKIIVGKHPDFVKVISVNPASLDFILKK